MQNLENKNDVQHNIHKHKSELKCCLKRKLIDGNSDKLDLICKNQLENCNKNSNNRLAKITSEINLLNTDNKESKACESKYLSLNLRDKENNIREPTSNTSKILSDELFEDVMYSKTIKLSEFCLNSSFGEKYKRSDCNSSSSYEDKYKNYSSLDISQADNANVGREDNSSFTNRPYDLPKYTKNKTFNTLLDNKSGNINNFIKIKEFKKLSEKKKRNRSRDQIIDEIINTNYQNEKVYSSDDAVSPKRLKRSKYVVSNTDIKFENFICPWCGEENHISIQQLAEHIRTFHPSIHNKDMHERILSESCNGVNPSSEDLNGCSKPVGMHTCGMCGLVFSSTLKLDQHVALEHHKAMPLPCSFCPIKFFDPGALQLHINTIHLTEQDQKEGPSVSTLYCCQCSHPCNSIYALADHMHEQHGYNQNKKNGHSPFSSFPYMQFLSKSLGQSMSMPCSQIGSESIFSPYRDLHKLMMHSTIVNQLPIMADYANLGYNYNAERNYLHSDRKFIRSERKFDNLSKFEHVNEQYSKTEDKYQHCEVELDFPKGFISNFENKHTSISSYHLDTKSPDHIKYLANKNSIASKNIKKSLTPPFCNVTCSECNNTFKNQHSLMEHVYTHYISINHSYGCSHCSKLFGSAEVLQKHLIDMHSQHLYRCNLCKQIFDSKVDLQVHFGVRHSSECEVITCIKCDATFRSQIHCQLHVNDFHLSQRMHDLSTDLISANMLNVSSDIGSVLGIPTDVRLRCLFCVERFSCEAELVAHIAQHKKQFVCPVCKEDFLVEYLLDKHMEARHGNEEWLGRDLYYGNNGKNSVDISNNLKQSKLSLTDKSLTSVDVVNTLAIYTSTAHQHSLPMHIISMNEQINIVKDEVTNEKESILPSKFCSSQKSVCKCEKCHEKFLCLADYEDHNCFFSEENSNILPNENKNILNVEGHNLSEQNESATRLKDGATMLKDENSILKDSDKLSPIYFDRYFTEHEGLYTIGEDNAYIISQDGTIMIDQGLGQTPASIENKMGSHVCVYCKQTFKSKGDMDRHCKSHQVPPNHKCNICDDVFTSVFVLAQHKLTHCKVIVGNICTVCKASLHSEEEFVLHCYDHSLMQTSPQQQPWLMQPSTNLACPICRQTLTSNIELHLHAQHHFQNGIKAKNSCEICHLSISSSVHPFFCKGCLPLSTNQTQYVHLPLFGSTSNSNDTKILDKNVCQQMVMQNVQEEQIVQKNKFLEDGDEENKKISDKMIQPRLYQCIKCQDSFSSEYEVQLHVASHVLYEGNVHTCFLCGLYFDSPARLQLHLIQHAIITATNGSLPLVTNNFSQSISIKNNELEINLEDLRENVSKDGFVPENNDALKLVTNDFKTHQYMSTAAKQDVTNNGLISILKTEERLLSSNNDRLTFKNNDFLAEKNTDELLLIKRKDDLQLNGQNDVHLICYVCSNELRGNASEVHAHMLQHGLHARKFACSQCTQKFYFVSELDNHVLEHLAKGTNGFSNNKTIFNEKMTNNIEKKIILPKFLRNVIKIDNENEIEVNANEKQFQDADFRRQLPEFNFDCNECQQFFVLYEDFARHRELHMHNNICHLCNMTYANVKMLKEHEESSHAHASAAVKDLNEDLTIDSVSKNSLLEDTADSLNLKSPKIIKDKSIQQNKKNLASNQQSYQSLEENKPITSDLFCIENRNMLGVDENNENLTDKSNTLVDQAVNCPLCMKKNLKKEKLKDHIKIHSINHVSSNALHVESKLMNLGVHACPICGGRFTQLDQLTHHIHKIHNKLSPNISNINNNENSEAMCSLKSNLSNNNVKDFNSLTYTNNNNDNTINCKKIINSAIINKSVN